MRHPDQIKQYLKEDEFKVYKLIWQRFVASQINPAVFDQTTVDIDAKNGNEVFWFRVTGSVLKFDGFLQSLRRIERRQGRRRRGTEAQAARARGRTETHAQGTEAGAAFHRASAALQRSFAGEGTRRTRHRPPVHLRRDSHHHSGAAVRAEGRRKVFSDRDWPGRDRSAGGKLPRYFRSAIHRAPGRRTRRNRRGQREVDRTLSATSTRNSRKISNMPKSIWRTSSGWRSPRTRSANAVARRW